METFKKQERLHHKTLIADLFERGFSMNTPPVRGIWMPIPAIPGVPAQIAISVSKKKFKHAVDRNKIKRRIREAYRRNKSLLAPLAESQKSYAMMFIFTGKDMPEYKELEAKIILILQRLL